MRAKSQEPESVDTKTTLLRRHERREHLTSSTESQSQNERKRSLAVLN